MMQTVSDALKKVPIHLVVYELSIQSEKGDEKKESVEEEGSVGEPTQDYPMMLGWKN